MAALKEKGKLNKKRTDRDLLYVQTNLCRLDSRKAIVPRAGAVWKE